MSAYFDLILTGFGDEFDIEIYLADGFSQVNGLHSQSTSKSGRHLIDEFSPQKVPEVPAQLMSKSGRNLGYEFSLLNVKLSVSKSARNYLG